MRVFVLFIILVHPLRGSLSFEIGLLRLMPYGQVELEYTSMLPIMIGNVRGMMLFLFTLMLVG